MNNNVPIIADSECQEQDHPLVRAAYAVGVGLILLGSVMPHGERWTMTGIALMAATFLY